MIIIQERFNNLQKLADFQKQEKAELQGQLKILTGQLKEKGIKNLKEASAKKKSVAKKIEEGNSLLKTKVELFESKYSHELQKIN